MRASPTVNRGVNLETAGQGGSRHLKIGAVLSYLVIGAQFVVAMVYTPIMLRILGQAQYGLYNLVVSIVGYLSLLSLGFSGAYMRFYSRFRVAGDRAGIGQLNAMFLLVFSVMGSLAALGGLLLSYNAGVVLGPEFTPDELHTSRVLFAILSVNLAVTLPASVFTSYIIAHERFVFEKSVQLARVLATPLATLPLLFLGFQSIGLAAGTTAVNIFFIGWTVLYSLRKLEMRFVFTGLQLSLLKSVAIFSSYLFLNMVTEQISYNLGKFFVGRFHGAAPVAVYGIALMLQMQYVQFSSAISSVFVPRVNSIVARGAGDLELNALFTKVGRIQFIVLGLVLSGFVFFGKPFIVLWAGSSYEGAYLMALFLIVPVTIPLIQNLGNEIQKAKNMHKFRTFVYLGSAVGIVLLGVPLTKSFAGYGAAAATGTSFFLGQGLMMNWYYNARIRLNIKQFWKQILGLSVGAVPAFALGWVMSMRADLLQVGVFSACVLTYVAVYAIGMWWFGMNNFERELFRAPVRWLRSRRR